MHIFVSILTWVATQICWLRVIFQWLMFHCVGGFSFSIWVLPFQGTGITSQLFKLKIIKYIQSFHCILSINYTLINNHKTCYSEIKQTVVVDHVFKLSLLSSHTLLAPQLLCVSVFCALYSYIFSAYKSYIIGSAIMCLIFLCF